MASIEGRGTFIITKHRKIHLSEDAFRDADVTQTTIHTHNKKSFFPRRGGQINLTKQRKAFEQFEQMDFDHM